MSEETLPREIQFFSEPGEHQWHKPEWLVAAYVGLKAGDGTGGPGQLVWTLLASGRLKDVETVTIGKGATGYPSGYCIIEMYDCIPEG